MPLSPTSSPRRPILGGILIACAVLSIALMAHHPVAHGDGPEARLRSLQAVASFASFVHGGLIVMLIAAALVLGEFARRFATRIGFHLYALGCVLLVLAALINGFVVPAFATATGEASEATAAVLSFAWQFNQVLARTGTLALALAIVCWSLSLWREGARWRLVGAIGLFGGGALAIALASHALDLHVTGMLVGLAVIAIWQAALGIVLCLKGGATQA